MTWSFVNSDGDVLPQKFHGPAHLLSVNTPLGCVAIAQDLDHRSQRFENGEAVDYQPPQPSGDHEWNADRKRWLIKQDVADRRAIVASAKAQLKALDANETRAVSDLLIEPDSQAAKARLVEVRAQKEAQRRIIQVNATDSTD